MDDGQHVGGARRLLMARKQTLEPVDIHRLVEAVGDGLRHEWMIRDLALADQILSKER